MVESDHTTEFDPAVNTWENTIVAIARHYTPIGPSFVDLVG